MSQTERTYKHEPTAVIGNIFATKQTKENILSYQPNQKGQSVDHAHLPSPFLYTSTSGTSPGKHGDATIKEVYLYFIEANMLLVEDDMECPF